MYIMYVAQSILLLLIIFLLCKIMCLKLLHLLNQKMCVIAINHCTTFFIYFHEII